MNKKNFPSRMEICLCSRCASVFYESKEYYIERLNPEQVVFEPCDICRRLRGYDFAVWNNKNAAIPYVGKEAEV